MYTNLNKTTLHHMGTRDPMWWAQCRVHVDVATMDDKVFS